MRTQIGPINRYVVSNVSHRPVRTLLSVLAIAVEVTMILTLVGELWDARRDSAPYARSRGGYHHPAAGLFRHTA
jgi:putative ABC transport system permease protein